MEVHDGRRSRQRARDFRLVGFARRRDGAGVLGVACWCDWGCGVTPIEKKYAIESLIKSARAQLAELEDGNARISAVSRRRYRAGYGPEDRASDYAISPSNEAMRKFMIDHTIAFIRSKETELRRATFDAADYADKLAADLRAEARGRVAGVIGGAA